jgi:hypothetical protein
MTTNSCMSDLSDGDLHAAYERASAKLRPSLDPDERVRVWQEIWALSGELGRRYAPATDPLPDLASTDSFLGGP